MIPVEVLLATAMRRALGGRAARVRRERTPEAIASGRAKTERRNKRRLREKANGGWQR